MRGDKVAPMGRTIPTRIVNSKVPRTKKCEKFTFRSDGEVWGGEDEPAAGSGAGTCKRSGRVTKCGDVLACTNTHAAHVYYHGWCWAAGLAAGRGSRRWDFMAKAEMEPLVRDRGPSEVQKQREARLDQQSDNQAGNKR